MKEFPLINKNENPDVSTEHIKEAIAAIRNYFPENENLRKLADDEIIQKTREIIDGKKSISVKPERQSSSLSTGFAASTDVAVSRVSAKDITDSCPYAIAVVVADCILLIVGFCGLHTPDQKQAVDVFAKNATVQISRDVPKWMELTYRLVAADSLTDKARAIFKIGSVAYRGGMFKGILSSIESSMPWYEWIFTGVAAVAQIAALTLSGGAAFIAEIAMNAAAVGYVVTDAIKVNDKCHEPPSSKHLTGKMGKETDYGTWKNPYAVQFPYTINGRTFYYGQDLKSKLWFIQELLPNGKMGQQTDWGTWKNPYAVQFPYTINGRTFYYGQDLESKLWFIQELLPNGKMGQQTDWGTWKNPYAVQFSYSIDGRTFYYGQDLDSKLWFIQELLPNGKMGQQTDWGTWKKPYAVQFPYSIDGRTFYYGQDLESKLWFIQELSSNGKMGQQSDWGTWKNPYAVQFPIIGDRKTFFYGQNLKKNSWFIQELLPGGKMGDETTGGTWKYPYAVQFPYSIDGRTFFYGQNLENNFWFIQELL